MKTLNLFACLAWLTLPGAVLSQPNYTNESSVATYARQMLYWPDAVPANRDIAAFRYQHLLYTNQAGAIRPDRSRISALYGAAERDRAKVAETELRRGFTNNPNSAVLGSLLLDLYYDRAAAECLLAGNVLSSADRARMGPPLVPTGLVIDDEIGLYRQALDAYRSALLNYVSLFNDNLGISATTPAGYRLFERFVAARGLEPAYCLSNGVPIPVTGNPDALFTGYKELVLLFNGLRDYGRAAASLAGLHAWRNNSGDLEQARNLITDSERVLFLQTSTLLNIFPGLDPRDTNAVDAASGLAEAIDGVSQALSAFETLRQNLRSGANLLGFESDFLMLSQKFAGQSGDIFDSFDALQLRLDPGDLSSPLRYAKDLQAEARDSFADYQGFQDELETQLSYQTGSAEDRLFQIVGAHPGAPEYEAPADNVGSEIWQQVQSIEVARLRIQKNQVQLNNLNEEVRIEVERAATVQDVTIRFANHQASLTAWIGHINAAQAFADSAAEAANPSMFTKVVGIVVSSANAVVQAAGEEAKGQLEAEKERQAGLEQAKIEGIESQARVKTLLLGMNTLAVDSHEAALLLKQEMGRLSALWREKADLERTLAESQPDLAGRYFADPVHHLRYQHQTMLANLSFDEAHKWLYFMARALEYKWNTPFTNYFYLGRRWSTVTLFKLRNAEELEQMYHAMVSFNSLVQLPKDDYFDWFSVRDDFFGYRMTNELGQLALYPDPGNPNGPANLTGVQAFRRRLQGLTNALGDIQLEFSTVREIPGGTFFRGPRFDASGRVLSAGLFLDKINWLKINLPGSHRLGRSQLAGELTYGGSSFIRNFDVGEFVPDRPDRLRDELTAYSTRYWFFHPPSAAWRFSAALKSPVTMQLTSDPRVPPTVQEIDVFKERSVASSGWVLSIPTRDLGIPVLNIDDLNDVELYFYHYAVSRQVPEGALATKGQTAGARVIPFPYHLRYEPNR